MMLLHNPSREERKSLVDTYMKLYYEIKEHPDKEFEYYSFTEKENCIHYNLKECVVDSETWIDATMIKIKDSGKVSLSPIFIAETFDEDMGMVEPMIRIFDIRKLIKSL